MSAKIILLNLIVRKIECNLRKTEKCRRCTGICSGSLFCCRNPGRIFLRMRVPDPDSVDLYLVGNRDDQAFPAVNDLCLHQVRAVRADRDRHVGGVHFETPSADYICREKAAFLTRILFELRIKFFHFGSACAGFFQEVPHGNTVQSYRIGAVFCLLCDLLQLVMYIFDCFKTAVFSESLFNQDLESFFLQSGGKRKLASEQPVRKIEMEFFRVFGIIKHAVPAERGSWHPSSLSVKSKWSSSAFLE